MNGLETFFLRERLKSGGFAPAVFRYPSTHASLAEVTAKLACHLRASGGTVHVVAHSLGGLIALETLDAQPDLPPGRVVLLGSPVQGSRSARAIAGWSHGPHILGALAVAELCRPREREWRQEREIGLIAGSRSAGLGRLFADLPSPNDGTVCVDETLLTGAASHRVLDVSHTGMLFSGEVAQFAIRFLRFGSFD
jgi:pimeloyl-ACP methyl ester carboxylesterase